VERLGRWALGAGSPLQDESVESFCKQLLAAGTGLGTREPSEVVTADLKTYSAGDLRFGVAQVEVTDLLELSEHKDELTRALASLREQRGFGFCLLMVTDVIDGTSRLLSCGEQALIADLPYPPLPDGTLDARGVVSRKKQLLPVILAKLEG
jgi:manganese-dependent inorganic pyrophosphatase